MFIILSIAVGGVRYLGVPQFMEPCLRHCTLGTMEPGFGWPQAANFLTGKK